MELFSRLINVLEQTKGEVLYRGGTPDSDDLFIPPHILDVSGDDPIMKDEVCVLALLFCVNVLSLGRGEGNM